jgi:hypothetical protein
MISKLKIENAGQIIMPAGKFLVERLKERKHTVTRMIPKAPTAEDAAKTDPVMDLEEVKNREPYYIQFFKVISAPDGETEYLVGDIVLAPHVAGAEFDLIPKSKVLNKFEIMGKFIAE